MKILVSLEHRFNRTPDGFVWSTTTIPYSFWNRYLQVFEHVRVLARVCDVPIAAENWRRSDGPQVTFIPIPYYIGPGQYLYRLPQILPILNTTLRSDDAIIMRIGSPIANLIQPILGRSGRPYGVEVVSDPYDVFSPGAVKHPLRSLFRWWYSRQMRKQCAAATATAYVTARALQRRYPPAPGAYTTHYSSIELPETMIADQPRNFARKIDCLRLIFVGSLNHLYKAPDVLIDAIAQCVDNGLDLILTVVGDGKHRAELEERARVKGILRRITFLGTLPGGEAIYQQLDQADIFVLPSRQEGLPRAMIEAMARGLPCIGSTVGGIPELLDAEDMVPPNDAPALANAIYTLVNNPIRLKQMSVRNLARSRLYTTHVLQAKRVEFYMFLRHQTEQWQQQNKQ